MANEVTLSGSLAYSDSDGADDELAPEGIIASVTTKRPARLKMSVTTSEVAIGLGPITSLGWSLFWNLSSTNYLEIRMASGASNDHIKVPAGAFALFHFGSDVTAPYAIANTAACEMLYLLCSL